MPRKSTTAGCRQYRYESIGIANSPLAYQVQTTVIDCKAKDTFNSLCLLMSNYICVHMHTQSYSNMCLRYCWLHHENHPPTLQFRFNRTSLSPMKLNLNSSAPVHPSVHSPIPGRTEETAFEMFTLILHHLLYAGR